jgi:hypothetical protein
MRLKLPLPLAQGEPATASSTATAKDVAAATTAPVLCAALSDEWDVRTLYNLEVEIDDSRSASAMLEAIKSLLGRRGVSAEQIRAWSGVVEAESWYWADVMAGFDLGHCTRWTIRSDTRIAPILRHLSSQCSRVASVTLSFKENEGGWARDGSRPCDDLDPDGTMLALTPELL